MAFKEATKWMFARSLAGHDKGRLYVICETDGDWLYLADGRLRTLDRPKKKKRMHVQIDYHIDQDLQEKMSAGLVIRDEDIRKALKAKNHSGGNE